MTCILIDGHIENVTFIGGVFLPPNEYFTSSSSEVITNLSCSLDFITFEESCEFDFTDDEECLNHTMDLILQCSFGRLCNYLYTVNAGQ